MDEKVSNHWNQGQFRVGTRMTLGMVATSKISTLDSKTLAGRSHQVGISLAGHIIRMLLGLPEQINLVPMLYNFFCYETKQVGAFPAWSNICWRAGVYTRKE
jgi:hypothetical protein